MIADKASSSNKSCSTFSIAALFGITTLVAVHCAFPALWYAILITIYLGILMAIALSPIAVVAIFLSPSKGAQLDVARNPFYKWLFRLYLVLLGLVYVFGLVMAIFYELVQKPMLDN